eukprot:CAMPEP_0113314734 /NCGR_PEP_ID=MMETSP0010_2-20120614/10671_1 /TAXON_ID=216773 ORGANISM="Corethron hystrix, Strain 308" /NCGR_SAMPLE_ID=MMETSP0010_2 /ASSEMBLY_ACC=CAM_ASM_000155 /LENGTH=232 /DNA_ID=CAMNT_0000171069 /DNA_START=357 /DNA_END=1055 /DNA_ORIENTATION=- /assembly_acc=CAM_ASM_000155
MAHSPITVTTSPTLKQEGGSDVDGGGGGSTIIRILSRLRRGLPAHFCTLFFSSGREHWIGGVEAVAVARFDVASVFITLGNAEEADDEDDVAAAVVAAAFVTPRFPSREDGRLRTETVCNFLLPTDEFLAIADGRSDEVRPDLTTASPANGSPSSTIPRHETERTKPVVRTLHLSTDMRCSTSGLGAFDGDPYTAMRRSSETEHISAERIESISLWNVEWASAPCFTTHGSD